MRPKHSVSMRISDVFSASDSEGPLTEPEQDLWEAVVERAVDDVSLWFAQEKWQRKESRRAARWIYSTLFQRDFLLCCEMADMDPDQVRRWAKSKWALCIRPDLREVAAVIWEKEVLKS